MDPNRYCANGSRTCVKSASRVMHHALALSGNARSAARAARHAQPRRQSVVLEAELALDTRRTFDFFPEFLLRWVPTSMPALRPDVSGVCVVCVIDLRCKSLCCNSSNRCADQYACLVSFDNIMYDNGKPSNQPCRGSWEQLQEQLSQLDAALGARRRGHQSSHGAHRGANSGRERGAQGTATTTCFTTPRLPRGQIMRTLLGVAYHSIRVAPGVRDSHVS